MRILFLMPYSPIPTNSGGAIRTYHMLKAATLAHDVTVATFGSLHDRELLRQHFGARVREIVTVPYPWINKCRRLAQLCSLGLPGSFYFRSLHGQAMQRAIDDVIDRDDFHAIQMEFPMMGTYRVAQEPLRLLDSHNVEYDNFHRMEDKAPSPLHRLHYHSEVLKIRREELAVCRSQDRIMVTSARDKAILDAEVPDIPKHIVPNGVDTAYFTPLQLDSEPHSMVFTGTMGYVPNCDAMLYFLDAIFPLILRRIPDAKIYIVGKEAPDALLARCSPNVVVTGCVDDVRPYLWRSSVYVVPLRMGGGTRLKVLEAMAVKKPIVTTSIGCEGINCRHGESVLLADTPEEFAQNVLELFSNRDLAQRLVDGGYDLARTEYDWKIIYQQVANVYELLAGEQRARLRSEFVGFSNHTKTVIAET